MAKVKVVGDFIFEFEVKHNQTEDIVIETMAIAIDVGKTYVGKNNIYVGKKTICVGKGDISKINPKAFDFIMNRIEYFLKRSGGYILNLFPSLRNGDQDFAIMNTIYNKQIEPLKTIIVACRLNDEDDVTKMLDEGWFLFSKDGAKAYIDLYNKMKAKQLWQEIFT